MPATPRGNAHGNKDDKAVIKDEKEMQSTTARRPLLPPSSTTTKSASSLWSDVPRRLATICIGFPLVWKMLETPMLANIFFMGAHALSAWEFTLLDPSPSTTTASATTRTTMRERLGFCTVSLVLAVVPLTQVTLFLALLVLTAGLFLVLLPRRYAHHWVAGLCLITIPFRCWCHLAQVDFPSTISVLLCVWNADTGALVAGRVATVVLGPLSSSSSRRWAVPALIQRISPKKSMEGFVGGILGGMWTAHSWIPILVAWGVPSEKSNHAIISLETSSAFDRLWQIHNDDSSDDDDGTLTLSPGQQRLALGFGLSILAILGDLVESSIKRQSQSKDSGRALPGHGGILDRFDSSLLAVVFYTVLLEWADKSHA